MMIDDEFELEQFEDERSDLDKLREDRLRRRKEAHERAIAEIGRARRPLPPIVVIFITITLVMSGFMAIYHATAPHELQIAVNRIFRHDGQTCLDWEINEGRVSRPSTAQLLTTSKTDLGSKLRIVYQITDRDGNVLPRGAECQLLALKEWDEKRSTFTFLY